jgi:CubicO group peptidase (beta-lactamase class C family)
MRWRLRARILLPTVAFSALLGCASETTGPREQPEVGGAGASVAPAASTAKDESVSAGSAAPASTPAPSTPSTPPSAAPATSPAAGAQPPAAMASGPQPMAAGASAPSAATPAGVVFPGAMWLTKSPADAGFDAAKLETAATDLLTSLPGRQCFAVFRDGYLVYEKYYTGDEHTLNAGFSTSKSFGATLVGLAVTQNLFTTEDLVASLVPDTTVAADVKIKHLLTMTGHTTPPGTMFDYGMGQMLLGNLANAIANKSGMSIGQFYESNLKGPLAFQDIDWGGGRFMSFAGNVSTTCRDGARLGHLWGNGGRWNGQQLISDAYYNEATTAAFPMANAGYGYNFWLNVAFSRSRRIEKSFAAMGANGQYIVVIPELQLVVTSYGNDPDGQMGGAPSLISGVLDSML